MQSQNLWPAYDDNWDEPVTSDAPFRAAACSGTDYVHSLRQDTKLSHQQVLAFTGKRVNQHWGKGRQITEKQVDEVRHRLRAHAYGSHGVDLAREFQQMDTDHNGKLSYDEFLHCIRRMVPLSDEQSAVLLAMVDTNGDGTVSHSELESFVLGEGLPQHHSAPLTPRDSARGSASASSAAASISATTPAWTAAGGGGKDGDGDGLSVGSSAFDAARTPLPASSPQHNGHSELASSPQHELASRASGKVHVLRQELIKVRMERQTLERKGSWSRVLTTRAKTSADRPRRRTPRCNWRRITRGSNDVAHATRERPKEKALNPRALENQLIGLEMELQQRTLDLQQSSLGLDDTRCELIKHTKQLQSSQSKIELLLQIVREIAAYMVLRTNMEEDASYLTNSAAASGMRRSPAKPRARDWSASPAAYAQSASPSLLTNQSAELPPLGNYPRASQTPPSPGKTLFRGRQGPPASATGTSSAAAHASDTPLSRGMSVASLGGGGGGRSSSPEILSTVSDSAASRPGATVTSQGPMQRSGGGKGEGQEGDGRGWSPAKNTNPTLEEMGEMDEERLMQFFISQRMATMAGMLPGLQGDAPE